MDSCNKTTSTIISVIVPVHNVAAWLPRCLNSILAQTLKDIEIILVENGSTDESLQICQAYSKQDRRIKVIIGNFSDLSAARNLGVKYAQGKYVIFPDGDDWIEPETYEQMLESIVKHNAEAVLCTYQREDEEGSYIDASYFSSSKDIESGKWVQKKMLTREISASACMILWPRFLFDKVDFPEGKLFEDHCTTFIWISQFKKVALINKPLYHYMIRKGSICNSMTKSSRHARDFFDAEAIRLEYIQNHEYYPECDSTLEAKMTWLLIGYLSNYLSSVPASAEDESARLRSKLLQLSKFVPKRLLPAKARLQLFAVKYCWRIYKMLFIIRAKISNR